jgi:hypothetical protein
MIVRAKGGGPIRTVVERGHTKPTGFFASTKSGRALPWEAVDERHFMWISEVDFRVTRFVAQPFRMDFYLSGGNKVSYFPDIERVLDGAIEIVEIKKTQLEIARDPYYAFKIGLARKVCRAKGWKFDVVTAEEHILPGYLLENAKLICLDRLTPVRTEDHIRFGEAMARGRGRLSYGEAVASLSGRDDPWDRDGVAKLHSLIAARFVCVDLTRKLSQATSVVLNEKQIWLPKAAG